MSQGEHRTDAGSVAPDVSLGKMPSDGAVADWVTSLSLYCRSGGGSSCLEAIPEVCQPHVLVLKCCDVRCARPWMVTDSSNVFKTLSQVINC